MVLPNIPWGGMRGGGLNQDLAVTRLLAERVESLKINDAKPIIEKLVNNAGREHKHIFNTLVDKFPDKYDYFQHMINCTKQTCQNIKIFNTAQKVLEGCKWLTQRYLNINEQLYKTTNHRK